jgi:hypothetical protein
MYTDFMPITKHASTSTGLNYFDLTNATPAKKIIIRFLLRNLSLRYNDLIAEIEKLPEAQRPTQAEIMSALEDLMQQKWLWKDGEGVDALYSVRLRKRVSRTRMRAHLVQRHASSFAQVWDMLDERAIEETGSSDAAATARISFSEWLRQLIRERIEAKSIIPILILLLAANTFVVAILDVVGVSGFIANLGIHNLPWLTIVDMFVGLIASGLYLQFTDRVPRVTLMKSLIAGLAIVYAAISIVYFQFSGALPTILFPIMFLLRAQQAVLFPVAFWNLANSLYSMSEAKRVFPLLASGEMIGGLIGYSIFSLPPLLGSTLRFGAENSAPLLAIGAGLFLINLVLLQFGFTRKDDDEDEEIEEPQKISFRQNINEGADLLRSIAAFRYLAVTVIFVWIAFSIFGYHFYSALNTFGEQSAGFETIYSIYSIATMFIPLILQLYVTPRLMKMIPTRNAFLILPGSMMIGFGAALLWLTPIAAVLAGFVSGGVLVPAWDAPAQQTVKALIPEERRGRASTLLSTYTYALGQIIGSLILGLILIYIPRWSGIAVSLIYLPVALAASLTAVFCAWRFRQAYEESLLSWRLSRRGRKSSMMDKLEF